MEQLNTFLKYNIMKDPKTTAAGIVTGVIILALVASLITHKINIEEFSTASASVTAFAIAVIGWLSKDKSNT